MPRQPVPEDIEPIALIPEAVEIAESSGPPPSLRKNFGWTVSGTATITACQWAIMSALAKLTSVTAVGQVALALAIIAPLMMLCNMHLRYLQSTDAKGEYRFGSYVSIRLLSIALLNILVFVVGLFVAKDPATLAVISFVALSKSFDSASDLIYGRLQQSERMDLIAKSQILQGSIQLTVLVAVLALTHQAVLGVVSMAIVSATIFVLYDLRNVSQIVGASQSLKPNWKDPAIKKLIILGLPMGATMALGAALGSLPRYFIANHFGDAPLGLFAAVSYVTIAGAAFTSALTDAFLPRLSQYSAALNERGFLRLFGKLLGLNIAVGLAGVALAVFVGEQMLTLLYRADYGKETTLLVWLMVGSVFNYLAGAFGCAITAMRKFHAQVYFRIFSLCVNLLLCAILIPKGGLIGAGQALLGGAVANAASNLILLAWSLRQTFKPVEATFASA